MNLRFPFIVEMRTMKNKIMVEHIPLFRRFELIGFVVTGVIPLVYDLFVISMSRAQHFFGDISNLNKCPHKIDATKYVRMGALPRAHK